MIVIMFREKKRQFAATHDYEPFGVELEPFGNDTTDNKYRFTGQERDHSTNFDYMHFRFYASSMGRFLKPDNIIGNISNPQSWNLYSYVNGNPVNFNDPSGHDFRGKLPFGLGMAQALMGPPGGTVWDQAMEMFYDESIDGFFVSYSDWTTGGDSTTSGQGQGQQVDPLASIPNASTLPEDQRNAYVLYGGSTPEENSDKANLPFPSSAAGEATDFLMKSGYNVSTIQITSKQQLKNLSKSGIFENSVVVVVAHFDWHFYFGQNAKGAFISISGNAVAKILGNSGALNVTYLSCKSSKVAIKTGQIGGMKTWGAEGLLHIHFVHPPTYYQSGESGFFGFKIDYWFITQH